MLVSASLPALARRFVRGHRVGHRGASTISSRFISTAHTDPPSSLLALPPGQWSVNEPDGTAVTYNSGDIAFALSGTALVFIMSPGVGFLYSGLLRRKNALNQIFLSLAAYAVVTFTWFFWGYSLSFSETGGPFIGNLNHFGMQGVLEQPSVGSSHLPALAYSVYQVRRAPELAPKLHQY